MYSRNEDRYCISIIKCVEKIENGYKEFDEVKDIVKLSYIEKAYKEMIDKMADEADIVVNEEVIDKIKVDSAL